MNYHKFMRGVLIFEAVVINFGTGLFCLVAPGAFVAQFSAEALPPVPVELIRWYGVLLWVLTYFVLRILPYHDNKMLFPAVEALLFGDLVHLGAVVMFFKARPVWDWALLVMICSASTLAVLRTIWLYLYHSGKLKAG